MDTITEQQQRISSLSANRPAEPPEMEQEQEQEQRTPHGEDLTTAAATAPAWDWGNLLDFTIDEDQSILSWEPPAPSPAPTPLPVQTAAADRVRKRDPRLTCENFMAGRVPCSCPELDEKEEEEGGIGKKRRTTLAALARCQVPGCEADIRELKGYHRRHRVCLRCANASTVMMDGEAKRYCQQCGKFHILADFDEGKRSCRRKLERHNNRRRRKSADCKSGVENEPQGNLPADDVFCDGSEKDTCNGATFAIDGLCLGNQPVDTDTILEPEDGNGSTPCSDPSFLNTPSNGIGITSFASSGETQTNGKDYSKPSLSSSFGGHKTLYSSVCPTGRMSFKLYDWNPAEFPRRLRHQIFQWLASMPVELEGYIRPGCTILTLFIAMPQCMWDKLSEDTFSFVTRLVNAPESLLSGRGPMHIYLNKMIFKTLKDGSLMNCNQAKQMPILHYVHPTCFEAGKPMELVACGNNLFQRKFRFLVSFSGRYLAYDSCISFPQRKTGLHHGVKEDSDQSSDHEFFKIHISSTESNLFGPAFIEVENESGLSNFIPVLFVDGQTCSELQVLEQRFSGTFGSHGHGEVDPSKSCRLLLSKQRAASELLLDIAWLLRGPCLDRSLSSIQIRRFTHLLSFLIEAEAIPVLERILGPLKVFMDAGESYNTSDRTDVTDLRLFQKLMDQAREILHKKLENDLVSTKQSGNLIQSAILQQRKTESKMLSTLPSTNGVELRTEDAMNQPASTSLSQESNVHAPLINKHIIMNVNQCPPVKKGLEWPRRTCHHLLSSTTGRTRLTLLIMTAIMCFGICVALGHPHEVGRFAVSVQRYLFSALNSR